MAYLRERMRSVNWGDVTVIVAFLLVYAVTLWFYLDDQHEPQDPVVQFGTREAPGESSVAGVAAPKPDVSMQAPSRPGSVQSESREIDSPPEEEPVQTIEEAPETFDDDSGMVEIPPETPAVPQETGPEGDLAISGRVLDRSGSPIEGIRVVARAYHLFDRDTGRPIPVRNYQRQTTSGYDGAYVFERLVDGEYHVGTIATDTYPRVQISVRAGVDFADLILTGQLELRVHGVVTTADDEPLAGVKISPVVQEAPEVYSTKDGSYEFRVKLRNIVSSLSVRASKPGYETQETRLTIDPPDADALELDIVMEADEETGVATVRGVVRGPGNAAVPNQGVNLSSAKERRSYKAMTDTQGRFEMRGVQPGDDYMLAINAPSIYQDYFRRDIRIPPGGVTLNIELEAMDTGSLGGQMVNLFGTPVSNFSMVLKTKETSFYNQRVFGDGSGYFEVENAPAGELLLRTESTPYHMLEGIQLPVGGSLNIPVVLDWGYDEIRGKVVDESGYPVAVPNIGLAWSHQQDGLTSTSRRTTAADEQGNFHFTQLGPGVHRLTISVAGYKSVTVNHDVSLQGSLLEVTLVASE